MEHDATNAEAAGDTPAASDEKLLQICRETLQVPEARLEDNFFELGGDSMLMMMVLARVRDEFGVELSHTRVFQSTTLRDLSAMIAGATSGEAETV